MTWTGLLVKHEKSCQFQCELCSGRYPSDLKLRSHMDNVHVKVTCDLCGENYTRVELKKHKATVHGIGVAPQDRNIKPFRLMSFRFWNFKDGCS